jgi:hypothetical protein
LPALVLLRKPLYGLAKRRKQPERYAKFGLTRLKIEKNQKMVKNLQNSLVKKIKMN